MQSPDNKENVSASYFVPPPTPLMKKIGFGTGVSVYYLDRSPSNHAARSPWALKTVNRQHSFKGSQFQKRLEAEARILQELKHPNIVGFRGFSKTEDGRKVLAMEECSKCLGNLIEEFAECGGLRFGTQQILAVVLGVTKALRYLHQEKGILHGDLKSYNVLIKGDFEEVKLCDFGVSLELKSATVENYVGTGAWSAPEALEHGPVTEKSDIFSLGLVIWEMLTLRAPHIDLSESSSFSGSLDTSSFEYEQHFGETPELPAGLTPDYALVVELFKWCTDQKWELRPSAVDILDKVAASGILTSNLIPEITL